MALLSEQLRYPQVERDCFLALAQPDFCPLEADPEGIVTARPHMQHLDICATGFKETRITFISRKDRYPPCTESPSGPKKVAGEARVTMLSSGAS